MEMATQRATTPSPSRKTPPSKCELLSLFPTSIPKFILDVLDDGHAEGIAEGTEVVVNPHYLEDFGFRVRDGHPDPTTQQLRDIQISFPGSTGVFFIPPFLTVIWPILPSKPWPLTVGGLPLFYTTCGNLSATPTFGRPARDRPLRAETVLRPWDPPTTALLVSIAMELTDLKLDFVMLMWCGVRFYLELECLAAGEALPSSICNLPVVWKVKQHVQAARRCIQPSPGDVVDSSPYEGDLRPGVYLMSGCRTRSTTSGIPLEKDGERFITVASHGFPVDFVRTSSSLIGHMEKRYLEADVALMKLYKGISYSDITFDGHGKGTRIHSMITCDEVPLGQKVFLDSPFNGKCDGITVARGVSSNMKATLERRDATHAETNYGYVTIHMTYFGNGMAKDIEPGTCGAVIWDEEENAIGFFSLYDSIDSVAYAPSTDILVGNNYVISAIK